MAGKRKKKEDGVSEWVRRDGALVLTFVNTGSRRSPRLLAYDDLLDWALTHGDVSASEAGRLRLLAAEQPLRAEAVFAAAEDIHDLMSGILGGLTRRQAPTAATLNDLNVVLARSAPRRVLVPGRGRVEWGWGADAEEIFRPLWAVALSATELLTSADCGKVRRCAGEDCDVLFVAKGAGMPRKWCAAKSCGDPARARKYYQKVTKPNERASRRQQREAELRQREAEFRRRDGRVEGEDTPT